MTGREEIGGAQSMSGVAADALAITGAEFRSRFAPVFQN